MKCAQCNKETSTPMVTVWHPERMICYACFAKLPPHPLRMIIDHINAKAKKGTMK